MNRRLFVKGGVSSLLAANTIIASAADAPSRSGLAWDYVFFDERFAEARRLAREMAGVTAAIAVQGDITGVWTRELAQASLATPLTMTGVTTESFFFCLRILLADQGRVDAQVSRIGRDLHLWTLRTDNHSKHGTTSWQNRSRPV